MVRYSLSVNARTVSVRTFPRDPIAKAILHPGGHAISAKPSDSSPRWARRDAWNRSRGRWARELPELRLAHDLHVEMGAMAHSERVARELT